MRTRLSAGLVLLLLFTILPLQLAVAGNTYRLEVPFQILTGDPGSVHEVYAGPLPGQGEYCDLTFAGGLNNHSEHLDSDVRLSDNDESVWFFDVERGPGVETPGSGPITPSSDGLIFVILGEDGLFSAEIAIDFDCEEVPPSTTSSTTTSTTAAPPTTTSTTTSTTTTTLPITTTTVTTAPPSTTTSQPPATTTTTVPTTSTTSSTTTSTAPPSSTSTTVPPTTSTTEAPWVTIEVEIVCDNIDDSSVEPHREPIVTLWDGNYDWREYNEWAEIEIQITDVDTGETKTSELTGPPTKGRHDHWFGEWPIDGRTFIAEVRLNGETVATAGPTTCGETVEPPIIVDPPPVEPPPELPDTGFSLLEWLIIAFVLLGLGIGMVMWKGMDDIEEEEL